MRQNDRSSQLEPVIDHLVDRGRSEEDGGLDFGEGLEQRVDVVEGVLVVEAERAGDRHGVVDVHGLRGDAGVGEEAEDHLLAGGGEAVEAGGADEAEELKLK